MQIRMWIKNDCLPDSQSDIREIKSSDIDPYGFTLNINVKRVR